MLQNWARAALAGSLLVMSVQSAQAAALATNTITVTDPASGGSVTIVSVVEDNFLGDFSKHEFRYTVTNNSFDPTPGTSNGLSGFQSIFLASVAGVADQYGPVSWFFNCCGGSPPPVGAEWDIDNTSGFGVAVGANDVFGYSVPAGTSWTSTWTGSWMHSWEFDTQANTFNLVDDTTPTLSILTPVELEALPSLSPLGIAALCSILGLVGLPAARRRRKA
jgi:hypothetical protein